LRPRVRNWAARVVAQSERDFRFFAAAPTFELALVQVSG